MGICTACCFDSPAHCSPGATQVLERCANVRGMLKGCPVQCCAGPVSNRTATPTASVLMPLDYGYPMQIFPGATFRFGLCQKVTPSVFLRVDLMSVPSLRKDNASAYAIHVWGQVRLPETVRSMLQLAL